MLKWVYWALNVTEVSDFLTRFLAWWIEELYLCNLSQFSTDFVHLLHEILVISIKKVVSKIKSHPRKNADLEEKWYICVRMEIYFKYEKNFQNILLFSVFSCSGSLFTVDVFLGKMLALQRRFWLFHNSSEF